jgi:apolipoprotein N-acyltransferase
MRTARMNEGLTVFALFFGLALLQAFERRQWWGATFWVAMGALFLLLGARRAGSGDPR